MKDINDEKKDYFTFSTFLPTLIVVILLNITSVLIFLKDIDLQDIQIGTAIILTLFWIMTAVLLTILIRYNAFIHYERPMKKLAKATKDVANGDFSVYVDPIHTMDKIDYLDRMILDFNRMVEELGSVETLKTDFFSNVSHEIKTPLAIIQNYSEILKNEEVSDQQKKEYIKTIYDTTKRLSDLITNILKLNKLEKQHITLNSVSYDLCKQLCDCILNYEDLWDKKNIEIDVNIEDSRMIFLDPSLLELVWNNLLSNAIKFTRDTGCIKISEYIKDDICYVSIKDNGCGMSEDTISHIFDKFYQGDTSHATQGNGLGLSLVARVIELLELEIAVESTLNEGTEFMIKIPLNK